MGLLSPTSRNRIRLRLAPYDVICAMAAPIAALGLRDPHLIEFDSWSNLSSSLYLFAFISTATALISFLAFRVSDGMTRFFSVHDLIAVVAAVASTVAATSFFLFTVTRLDGVPRSTPAILALVLGGALVNGRAFHRAVALERDKAARPQSPDQLRNIVIVGADRFSALAAKLIASQSPRTARVLALLDERPEMIGRAVNGVRVVGSAHDLDAVLDEYAIHGVAIDQVLISDIGANLSVAAMQALSGVCDNRDIEIMSLADAFNLKPKPAVAQDAAEAKAEAAPIVTLPAYFGVKRAFDVLASVALLTVLAPATALVAGLVLVDVGTPLLFWQERIGRNGRRFLLYKFRTYRAPYDWRGRAIDPGDRLSLIGRLIRASRFDEIPQLLNILVGDMSLIGPRPLLPKDQPKDMSIRLLARPGITGWAQVNGGNLVNPEEKEALDAWYIQHASPKIDIKILVHSLIIAATGERFNRRAIADALHWRGHLAPNADSEARVDASSSPLRDRPAS